MENLHGKVAGVANAVHDAVLEKKIYMLTREVTRTFVEKRTRHTVEGTNPTPPGEVLGSLSSADSHDRARPRVVDAPVPQASFSNNPLPATPP